MRIFRAAFVSAQKGEKSMDAETLSLENICGGAVEEVFQRELAYILANIADVNTDAEAKRKITFEFTFEPFDDRSGAKVIFACKSKQAPVNTASGTMFLSRKGTNFVAIPHDPKQARLFVADPGGGEKKKDLN
jgi:hypothetical protein